MEINISPQFGDVYSQPEGISSPSSFVATNNSDSSSVLSHVGNRDGSCYVNGTREYKGFYQTSQFVTGLILYPILCVVGIIGNSLSVIVLSHKDMATPTNVYLLALGLSDSLKLLNDFLYFIMLIISINNPAAGETMMVNVYPYAHYIFQVAVCVTAWLTVSVAMDRYMSVCHPSRAKSLCTIVRARSMVVSVYIIMILISIPSVFRYRLQTVHDVTNNMTCMELVVTELGRNKEFMIPYTWAQNFLRGIIPVFILIFLNVKIINVLRKERVKGKKFSARNRITLMLITMIVVFILCITPDAIMSTFFGKGYVEEGYMVKGVREYTDCLLALNSAINFILYCSLSNLFRATFVKVFFGKRYLNKRGGSFRPVSTYCPEATTVAPSPDNFCRGSSGKRKNNNGKCRFFRKEKKSNDSQDTPTKDPSQLTGTSGQESYGKRRNNSLCYTDENNQMYADMSGVWLGPAPKDPIPRRSSSKKSRQTITAGDDRKLSETDSMENADVFLDEENSANIVENCEYDLQNARNGALINKSQPDKHECNDVPTDNKPATVDFITEQTNRKGSLDSSVYPSDNKLCASKPTMLCDANTMNSDVKDFGCYQNRSNERLNIA